MTAEVYSISDKTRQMQLANEGIDADNRKLAIQGLLVLGGMLIVGAVLVAIIFFVSDSDLTDALQECGYIRVQVGGNMPSSFTNESVDECRKQAFEFYKDQ